jgi:hypothetical protein
MDAAKRALSWLEASRARRPLKVLLTLLATALSTLFFGLVVPFFLLSAEVLPSIGVAGVIYVAVGGLVGLCFGAISSGVSLAKSPRLVTGYYAGLVGGLSVLSLVYLIASLHVDWLQRHH